jgi:hypothetical protein
VLELDSSAAEKLEPDELGVEKDWALAKPTARIATPKRSKTRCISDNERRKDMLEPP